MSLVSILAACAFVAAVGALVAFVDLWRESRLGASRAEPPGPAPLPAGIPQSRRRAA